MQSGNYTVDVMEFDYSKVPFIPDIIWVWI